MNKFLILILFSSIFIQCDLNNSNSKDNNSACDAADGNFVKQSETRQLILGVDHYKFICWGPWAQTCMLTEYVSTGNCGIFYNNIDGFNFQWGNKYLLSVQYETIQDSINLDGINKKTGCWLPKYTLLEIISQEKVPENTRFKIVLKQGNISYVSGDAITGFSFNLSGFPKIICATDDVCFELEQYLNGTITYSDQVRQYLKGEFSHSTDSITLHSISEGGESFLY